MHSRIINNILYNKSSNFLFSRHRYCHCDGHFAASQHRSISSTSLLQGSWMDKVKSVFTGQKGSDGESTMSSESFTLLRMSSLHCSVTLVPKFFFFFLIFCCLILVIGFADELKKARRVGTFKQYMVGRSSEATFSGAFEKQEAIIRCLGGFDSTGEVVFLA